MNNLSQKYWNAGLSNPTSSRFQETEFKPLFISDRKSITYENENNCELFDSFLLKILSKISQHVVSSLELSQWFPNFSGVRTTSNISVLCEAQNIDFYRDWRTTWTNLADHQWSAEQTLGITELSGRFDISNHRFSINFATLWLSGEEKTMLKEHQTNLKNGRN